MVTTMGLLVSYQAYETNEWGSLAFFRLASFSATGAAFVAVKDRVHVASILLLIAVATPGVLYFFDLAGLLTSCRLVT